MTAKKIILKCVSVLGYIILAALIALVAFLAYMRFTNKVPMLFNHAVLRVISPSMTPDIPLYSYILVEKVDPGSLKEGDIISFYSRDESIYGMPNTHKIEAVTSENSILAFQTKGIANQTPDSTLALSSDVIGKYKNIVPALGLIGSVVNNQIAFLAVVIIPAAIFFIFEVINLVRRSKKGDSGSNEQREPPDNSAAN